MVVLETGAKLSVYQVSWILETEVKEEFEMLTWVGRPDSRMESLPSPILFFAMHSYLPKSDSPTLSTMRV